VSLKGHGQVIPYNIHPANFSLFLTIHLAHLDRPKHLKEHQIPQSPSTPNKEKNSRDDDCAESGKNGDEERFSANGRNGMEGIWRGKPKRATTNPPSILKEATVSS
jgi:hypothetical protein